VSKSILYYAFVALVSAYFAYEFSRLQVFQVCMAAHHDYGPNNEQKDALSQLFIVIVCYCRSFLNLFTAYSSGIAAIATVVIAFLTYTIWQANTDMVAVNQLSVNVAKLALNLERSFVLFKILIG
jgi:hypothetical protein